MKKMLTLYFTEKRIWLYIGLAVALLAYVTAAGLWESYWYMALIPIVIAPFYEWLTHKYILHLNIGTIQTLPIPEGESYHKGQKVTIESRLKKVEAEVMEVKENEVVVGTGWAQKLPWLYHFMDDLHYGHHRDPDYVPLIFAPALSVMLLYLQVFLLCLLFTFSLDKSLVFLFGSMCYYMFYEWKHLGHHVKGFKPLTPLGKQMKRIHQLHHYKNENFWWGITNPLGDMVLKTYKDQKEVEKSGTVRMING